MSRTAALLDRLKLAKTQNLVGNTFKHYKGGIYTVTGLCIDTDDGEVRVLYHRVGGPEFDAIAEDGISFVRPLAEFNPDRFQRIDTLLTTA